VPIVSRMVRYLAVLALFTGASDGTTAVVIRSDTFVLIGADSLVSTVNPETGRGGFVACKIVQTGRFFVVVTNFFGEGGSAGFNAYAVLQDIAQKEVTAVAIADRFEKVALKPYLKFLANFQKMNAAVFNKYCNNKECMQLLVADYNGGNPTYALRRFQIVLKHNVPTVKILPNRDCPGTCPIHTSNIVIGDNIEAGPLAQSPIFWAQHSLASGIEELIHTEAVARPNEVGGKVTILALDQNGPHWVPGYQGVCPDLTAEDEGTHQAPNRRTDLPEQSRTLMWIIVAAVLLALGILWYAISHRRTGK